MTLAVLVAVVTGCGGGAASGQPGVLTLALSEDPDELDPTISGSFVSRMVFVDMCEKLYDVGPRLDVVPQLATSLPRYSKDRKTCSSPTTCRSSSTSATG